MEALQQEFLSSFESQMNREYPFKWSQGFCRLCAVRKAPGESLQNAKTRRYIICDTY